MEEKLQEILDYQEGRLHEYETVMNRINAKIAFMSEHNFDNELRILHLRKEVMQDLLVDYRISTREIRKLLLSWNS